jgi:hypothetical protein
MAYSGEDQEQKQVSKWGKCSASECPIDSSINTGEALCSFHAGQERMYYPEVTMAINEHMDDYKRYCSMVRWSAKMWSAKMPMLKSDGKVDFSDMGDNFFPSVYIERFKKYLETMIRARSNDLVVNPGQQESKPFSDKYSDDGLWRK